MAVPTLHPQDAPRVPKGTREANFLPSFGLPGRALPQRDDLGEETKERQDCQTEVYRIRNGRHLPCSSPERETTPGAYEGGAGGVSRSDRTQCADGNLGPHASMGN